MAEVFTTAGLLRRSIMALPFARFWRADFAGGSQVYLAMSMLMIKLQIVLIRGHCMPRLANRQSFILHI
jgi:hypothetical protein